MDACECLSTRSPARSWPRGQGSYPALWYMSNPAPQHHSHTHTHTHTHTHHTPHTTQGPRPPAAVPYAPIAHHRARTPYSTAQSTPGPHSTIYTIYTIYNICTICIVCIVCIITTTKGVQLSKVPFKTYNQGGSDIANPYSRYRRYSRKSSSPAPMKHRDY